VAEALAASTAAGHALAMSVWSRLAVLLGVAAVVVASAGCQTPMKVKVEGPHTTLFVNGTDLGAVPPEGIDVKANLGVDPLAVSIARPDGRIVETTIPRTEPVWWLLGVVTGGALCCAGTTAATGFCVANPALFFALLLCPVSGPGAVVTTLAAPSWFTVPLVGAGGALGLSLFSLAAFGTAPAAEVVVGDPAPAPAEADTPEPAAPNPSPVATAVTTSRVRF
jgi:hypothetical protein